MNETPKRKPPPPELSCLGAMIMELLGRASAKPVDASAIDAAASMLSIAIGVRGEQPAEDLAAMERSPFCTSLVGVLRKIAASRTGIDDAIVPATQEELRDIYTVAKTWRKCIPQSRVIRLLNSMCNHTVCEKCGRTIWFIKSSSGKFMPMTDEGINHFADCEFAGHFGTKAAPPAAAAEGKPE